MSWTAPPPSGERTTETAPNSAPVAGVWILLNLADFRRSAGTAGNDATAKTLTSAANFRIRSRCRGEGTQALILRSLEKRNFGFLLLCRVVSRRFCLRVLIRAELLTTLLFCRARSCCDGAERLTSEVGEANGSL
ncbi:MAG: hypothetical protein MPK06_08600 [Alphaproteobacteria bacterium]|nr:hypothetical protein [Alphaproteobacteria bacterium]MDA8006566.1 hypothetical protein [Alphaproteobacteria bacterium]MDA8013981.1 hypothetical protein [Alphaproteobacteria bacterium]